jgi:predicted flap endonuclease-1-like 5' DNA nuclease
MMEQINALELLSDYGGIFALMLSTFLIGYFAGSILQKAKTKKLIKTLQGTINKLRTPEKTHDIETIFTEIKPKIREMVKETQEEERNVSVSPPEEVIAEKTRTSYISYTKNKPELNFENFGHSSPSEKDDLTRIMGIGPYIEQKLNEIGIYTYDQISQFTDEDIRTITELIDFFPGRIDRDNWVGQARAIKVS